jgi:hypothetical protein
MGKQVRSRKKTTEEKFPQISIANLMSIFKDEREGLLPGQAAGLSASR